MERVEMGLHMPILMIYFLERRTEKKVADFYNFPSSFPYFKQALFGSTDNQALYVWS